MNKALKRTGTKKRNRAADYSRRVMKEAGAVVIKKVADRARRKRCEADVFLWLQTYLPSKFRLPFSDDQRAMTRAILDALVIGGDQAVAGPRAGGKSSLVEGVLTYCVVRGLVRFAVIFGSNGKQAKDRIGNIKRHFDRERILAADYPEICGPIWALENRLQRCASQHIDGDRTSICWTDNRIVFPTVKGSKASGAVIMSGGIDSGICGMNIDALRPDLVILDDIDRDWSPTETAKYEDTIETDIAGLGGPDKKLARVFLGTIPDRRCNAYTFTDPKLKPSWKGKRFRSIVEWPTRMDLWDEYTRLWVENQETDPTARIAHKFYLANREEMDLGAVLSNPHRMKHIPLGDGTLEEESALQSCFNYIARYSMASFLSEHQNDPPEDLKPEGSGITEGIVARRLNGMQRKIVPPGCKVLVSAVDPGKWRLHFSVVSWRDDATGFVIDYGTRDVYPEGNADEAIELAIVRALHEQREDWEANPYTTTDGEVVPINICLIDCGYHTGGVFQFCREVGGRLFRPSKGAGESSGDKTNARFTMPAKGTFGKILGEHCFHSRQPSRIWLTIMNCDYWKMFTHNRFLTPPDRPGSLTLWGENPREHTTFARQIVAEVWEEQPFELGKKPKAGFTNKSRDNHYLDVMYGCACAAGMCGVRLLGDVRRPVAPRAAVQRPRRERRPNFALQGGRSWHDYG